MVGRWLHRKRLMSPNMSGLDCCFRELSWQWASLCVWRLSAFLSVWLGILQGERKRKKTDKETCEGFSPRAICGSGEAGTRRRRPGHRVHREEISAVIDPSPAFSTHLSLSWPFPVSASLCVLIFFAAWHIFYFFFSVYFHLKDSSFSHTSTSVQASG